ncbi:4Fe-4S dicluster domain-containing protein [Rhodovastum atsumiense]|uniref:4Fe-4S dicluster domain-containing protein n=1 Tax=Rhodovastum atsumiense TaxID=504468 RepID=A0A5M6IV55_9PROT|nr:4Fe-4S binding protein [Rhodovastum atsumiense]KAA5612193.1 4Fe-4S dicluster domain-containing protein [Rhodovastum atsumiense]CAH2603850.1 4Fe-4S dicluster domain-containing protein [Rhodovastum atsumiense]
MNFLTLFARNLRHGPYTESFPFGPAPTAKRFRGRITFDAASCEGCRVCERVCPAGAIRFARTPEGMTFDCWHDTCVFCGNCEFHCPTKSIQQSADWHLAHRQEAKFTLVEHGLIPNQPCSECGAKALATAPSAIAAKPPLVPEEVAHMRTLCPKCRARFLKSRRTGA